MARWVLGAAATALLWWSPAQAAQTAPISIVAAENFYGDVAQQLAGPSAKVTSILSNPDEDPHLFEASPSVARALAAATIAVYNGVDYDPWMAKLLGASVSADPADDRRGRPGAQAAGQQPASLVRPGDDGRLRPSPAGQLAAADPAHRADTETRLQAFLASLAAAAEPGRGPARPLCRHAGHRDRAGVRLHGRGPRARQCTTSDSSLR